MAKAWSLKLPQEEKFVLLALADHADDEGRCFPSVGRLAWKTGYSERQIQRVQALLTRRGLIEVPPQTYGRGRTKVIHLRLEKGDELSPFTPDKGCHPRRERVTPTSRKGDIFNGSKKRNSQMALGLTSEKVDQPSLTVINHKARATRFPSLLQKLQAELRVGAGPSAGNFTCRKCNFVCRSHAEFCAHVCRSATGD